MADQTQATPARSEADSARQAGPPIKRYARLAPLHKAMIWTSFVVNLVLLIVVIVLAGVLISYHDQSGNILNFAANNVSELQDVVTQLEGATIKTTIPLSQPLSLAGKGIFVPVDQITEVRLTQPVPLVLSGADIDLGGGNRLRADNINLTLPEGTPLQIALKMNIPLDSVTIPVQLDVPVSIPLAETELGPQFRRLGAIVHHLADPFTPLLPMPKTPPDSSTP